MRDLRSTDAFGALALGAILILTGCDGFWQKPNNTGSGGSSGSGGSTSAGSPTSDYAYTVNSNSSISGFVVGKDTLTNISGSPFVVQSPLSSASSIVVSPKNVFVYVGGTGGILGYGIVTTGALTPTTQGGVTEQASFASLAISPNGQYLLGLDSLTNYVWVFSANLTTGALTLLSQTPTNVNAANAAARMIQISPNGYVVAVAEGTGGDDVFAFNQTNGALTAASSVNPPAVGYTDLSVAFDPSSTHLLVGRGITAAGTSQVLSFNVSTGGALGSLVGSYNSGADPYAVLVDSTGAYAYTANRGVANLSGYTVSSGALTAMAASPFVSGNGVTALVENINKTYVIAAAAGGTTNSTDTFDLTLYSFDSTTAGKLNMVFKVNNKSGVTGSIAIAATHPN